MMEKISKEFRARRIMFRVFDIGSKKCHLVGEDEHDSMKCDYPDHEVYYYNYHFGEGSVTYEEKIPEDGSGFILMQYTGVDDKNKLNIFEYDICLVKKPGVVAKGYIGFYQGAFCFKEFNTDRIIQLLQLNLKGYSIEVIGNIGENPELVN